MPKLKTTDCCWIDIREMKRDGLLELLRFDGEFQWHLAGFERPVSFTAAGNGIMICHRDRLNCWIEYLIPVEHTDCHIKGSRPWFSCPECGRRAALLYSKLAGKFACRKCQRLAYPSQSEAVGDRAHRAANNIRRRLGWKVGTANPEGDKPKWMHWSTFEKLHTRHAKAAQAAWMDTARGLGMIPRKLPRLKFPSEFPRSQ